MSVFPCHQKLTKVEGCDCECHDIEDTRVLQGAEEGSNKCQESLTGLDLPFQATCCYNELKGGALACCGDPCEVGDDSKCTSVGDDCFACDPTYAASGLKPCGRTSHVVLLLTRSSASAQHRTYRLLGHRVSSRERHVPRWVRAAAQP